MRNRYKIIDLETWKRKEHYQIYRNAVQPQYCVGFELDVTNFKKYVKEKKWSFTMALIFAVTKCANEMEEFRYRFLNGQVVLYETINTSFTYLDKETELFKVVNVPMQDTVAEFIQLATVMAENQKEYFKEFAENDIYQFSALPWITFTYISHADYGNRENAQPIFDWGKYYEREGRFIMPFAVRVHHSFVDGIHIGKLADKLQQYLGEIVYE